MDKFKITLQYIMPKHLISRLVGFLAAARLGFISHTLIKLFIRAYGINMAEAKFENASDYKSFNEFFTRPLKDGLRPVVQDDNIIAHPVDGAISQLGKIDGDKLIQAKGHDYSLQALLGGLSETAAPYQNGEFACIYLAPKDYHRIHMPVAGTLREMIYVPGELFSVNPLTAANVPGLFARNERVVTIFDTELGPMALVLVGATIVASIETVWAGTITPPTGKEIFRWSYPATGANAVHLEKGAEMGRFKLGSTVILAFAPDKIEFLPQQYPGAVTRMGEAFAAKKH
ncbi:archaetidylserine decarboxylase [Rheinheimera sp. 4Y26]|uniref:archaetidylserine decarboxylase n=1 Tax=Rheinheimera sp. 4Y26 TaxID=2977811 RepID=UPI0021B10C1A|nr:archaetidylserine decarboxylase [Rheinheimera sp. 4Y26]MCT6698726.1 archaetidylserine decarboxylase [Rheinheimera sp. 4Y26]